MTLVYNAPAVVSIPWRAPERDVLQNDRLGFIQRALRARMDPMEARTRVRAIMSGLVPVFGRLGQVAHDGAAQSVQPVSIVIDGYRQAADVGTAVGFAGLDQGGDGAFGRLKLLCGAEVSQGVLHGSCCGAAMEERVAGGGQSSAGGEIMEPQP